MNTFRVRVGRVGAFFMFGALFAACATAPFDSSKPIEIRDGVYQQNGQALDIENMASKLGELKETSEHISSARRYNIAGLILGMPGGFVFGWQLGTAVAGREANWVVGGIGAAAWVTGITLSAIGGSKVRDAVDVYNARYKGVGEKKSSWKDRIWPFLANADSQTWVGGVTMSW